MDDRNFEYFRCSHLQAMSPLKLWRFLKKLKSPGKIFEMDDLRLKQESSFTDKELDLVAAEKKELSRHEKEYEQLIKRGINYICIEDEGYPNLLKQLPDPPIGLFFIGKLPDENSHTVAIVGARACSEYGRSCAEYLGEELARAGVQVVSGMAYGIDCISQCSALKYSSSFAVLGGGVDICYPQENIKLYEQLKERGGIISEMLPGTKNMPFLFPRRNRIISGLSEAVVVVEARKKSGSLITADFACEQGRDVYAVPGRVDSKLSSGCNDLIRNGAYLLQEPQELLEDLHIESIREHAQRIGSLKLDRLAMDVYLHLSEEPISAQELLERSSCPSHLLPSLLVKMELGGYVSRVDGYLYKRTKLIPPSHGK